MNYTDSEFIREFCLEQFQSNYRLSSDESELIIPSIFVESDPNRHMSINLETGLWQCFKTSNKGNFLKLYSITTGIPYRKAYEEFMYQVFITEDTREKKEIVKTQKISKEDVESFVKLDVTKAYDDHIMATASEFVYKRGLEGFEFYVCKEGVLGGRLIIPYKDINQKLFFYQARALFDQQPKYLNCRSIKSSWVLYPYDYGATTPLFITEGAFDCLALKKVGLNATSTLSCNVSHQQMRQLKNYNGPLVVAYDSDDAGMHGVRTFLRLANKHKLGNCFFVSPDKSKDWNEMLLKYGKDEIISIALEKMKLNDLNLLSISL